MSSPSFNSCFIEYGIEINDLKIMPNIIGHTHILKTEQSYVNLLREIYCVLFMEQKLTCGNHSDKEIVLDQIGWNSFNCPKCGSDYSIGRKVVTLDPKPMQRR
ncbi:MAG: hypothetical protein ACREAD_00495 [Nitrosopumilaceae archaeon]